MEMVGDSAGLRRARTAALAFLAGLVVLAAAVSVLVVEHLHLRAGPNEYDIPAWEVRNFANKWLYAAGEIFRESRSLGEEDADLRAFFDAVDHVGRLEGREREAAALAEAEHHRDRLENLAEATIEGRITAIAEREGLTRGLWILPDSVWPPVDMEFTAPPRSLATSRRDRIELLGTNLLREGLSLSEVEAVERQTERRDGVSALAFPTSGVGAYPTIVTYTSSYRAAVEVAAHEWMHNYLSFRPLGVRYFDSNDLRTMNETVADLVGREIAAAVVAEWPIEEAMDEPEPPAPSAQGGGIDLRSELVSLRAVVEALLAEGKVEEAEKLMEVRRQYLADNGHYIRRINQAFFAFTNLYAGEAGNPAAVNPIGPKLDELRALSPTLADFVRVAGDLTGVEDLDRALAEAAKTER